MPGVSLGHKTLELKMIHRNVFIMITIIHFTDDSLEDQGVLYTCTMNSAVGLKILASISLAIAPKTTICIKLLCMDCSRLTGLQHNVLR